MPGREHHSDHTTPLPDGDEPSGVRGTFASFAQGLQQYLAARGELLAIESREAGRIAGRKGILAAILAAALFFAYSLLLVAAVSLAGHWLALLLPDSWSQFGWQAAAVTAALLHLGVAAACYRTLRKPSQQPLFEVTRSEFEKDRQWLNDQQTTNGKKS
jgi:uncharacterized membrane protein YqjE